MSGRDPAATKHQMADARAVRPKPWSNPAAYGAVLVLVTMIAAVVFIVRQGKDLFIPQDPGQQSSPAAQTTETQAASLTCPEVAPATIPPILAWRAFYILIDRTGSYKAYTQWALNVVKDVIPRVLAPGEVLDAAWIRKDSANQDGTFCCDHPVAQVPLPQYIAIPPQPVPLPTMEVSPDASSMDQVIARTDNARVAAQNAKALNDYYCALESRNQDIASKLQHRDESANAVVEDFWKRVSPKFSATRFDSQTHIKEALYRASITLSDDPDRNIRYLVIFSDLLETGAPAFDGVHPDFTTIRVIVVLECSQANKCEQIKSNWTKFFTNMGAAPPLFILDAHPEEKLIRILSQR